MSVPNPPPTLGLSQRGGTYLEDAMRLNGEGIGQERHGGELHGCLLSRSRCKRRLGLLWWEPNYHGHLSVLIQLKPMGVLRGRGAPAPGNQPLDPAVGPRR